MDLHDQVVAKVIASKLKVAPLGVIVDGVLFEDLAGIMRDVRSVIGSDLRACCIGGQKNISCPGVEYATTIEQAVSWRNDPDAAGSVVVFLPHDIPKAHSLARFDRITSRDLAMHLLRTAQKDARNEVERRCFAAIERFSDRIPTMALEEFIADISKAKLVDRISRGLWHLGLAQDASLHNSKCDQLERLRRNFDSVQQLAQLSEQSRKRMAQVLGQLSGTDKRRMQELYASAMAYHRRGNTDILRKHDLEAIEQLIKHGKPMPKATAMDPGADPTDPTNQPINGVERPLKGRSLDTSLADLVSSDEKEDVTTLRAFVEGVREQFDKTAEAPEYVELGGRTAQIDFTSEEGLLLERLKHCCTEAAWGVWFESSASNIDAALSSAAPEALHAYDPNKPTFEGGLSLIELFRRFDSVLKGKAFSAAFAKVVTARAKLVPDARILATFPLPLFKSNPNARKAVIDYIDAYAELLSVFRNTEAQLHQQHHMAVKIAAAEILRLDVVHVKCGNEWKAMLTPLHPLYLWRYKEIIRALDAGLPELDRERLAEVLPDLPQVLHFLVSAPGAEGIAQHILPLAGKLLELPTYENHTNRYLGNDGLPFVADVARLWLQHAPYTRTQLRIALLDCPNILLLLRAANGLMESDEVAQIVLDVYTTRSSGIGPQQLRLDENDEDIIEAIRSQRIILRAVDIADSKELGTELERLPVHLLCAFDQGEFKVEASPRAHDLLVSPLVISYEYRYEPLLQQGIIAPSSDTEDGIFSDFHYVVHVLADLPAGKLPRLQNTESPSVANLGRALTAGSARWLLCADRSLTSYKLNVGVKLVDRVCGQREVGVWAVATYHMLSVVTDTLAQFSLHPSPEKIRRLFEDFGHVAKAGWPHLLEVERASSTGIDTARKGALGSVIAAAWYCSEYPDAMVAPLDSPLARQWLLDRDDTDSRADLIGIRADSNGRIIVEPIEVKAHATDHDFRFDKKDRRLLGHAVDQLQAMLKVLDSVFGDGDQQPLFTPARREALKYQLHRECFRGVPDQERPQRWFDRLQELFALPKPKVAFSVQGLIVSVRFESVGDTRRISDAAQRVELVEIEAKTIQRLIDGDDESNDDKSNSPSNPPSPVTPKGALKSGAAKESISAKGDRSTGSKPLTGRDSAVSPRAKSKASTRKVSAAERDDLETLAAAFRRACQSFSIHLAECDPEVAIVGPNVYRFYIRLGRGQRLSDLRRSLEDVGREMSRTGLVLTTIEHSDQLALDVPRLVRDPVNIDEVIPEIPQPAEVHVMPIPIGMTPEGEHVIEELNAMPHLIVGGTTGAGKTVFLYGLLASLLKTHPRNRDLRLILSSSKKEDFSVLKGLRHLEGGSIIDDAEAAIEMFQGTVQEIISERKEVLDSAGCRDITAYNKTQSKPLAPVVIIIDEFADLADQLSLDRKARSEFYKSVRQVAQAGRSRGVHLVLCTQRPSAQLVPTDIRSLMNFRIAFHVNKREDSQMIIDDSGAEQLQMKGDLLYKNDKGIRRAQGYFTDVRTLQDILKRCE